MWLFIGFHGLTKKMNFENEEKINPFAAMNQINLDVDFYLTFPLACPLARIVVEIPWKYCNMFAFVMAES